MSAPPHVEGCELCHGAQRFKCSLGCWHQCDEIQEAGPLATPPRPSTWTAVQIGRCPNCDEFPREWRSDGMECTECGVDLDANVDTDDDGTTLWTFDFADQADYERKHATTPPPAPVAPDAPDCLRSRTPEELAAHPRLRPEDIEAALQRGIRDRNAALGLPMAPEPRTVAPRLSVRAEPRRDFEFVRPGPPVRLTPAQFNIWLINSGLDPDQAEALTVSLLSALSDGTAPAPARKEPRAETPEERKSHMECQAFVGLPCTCGRHFGFQPPTCFGCAALLRLPPNGMECSTHGDPRKVPVPKEPR
jgi:hypothetical protein